MPTLDDAPTINPLTSLASGDLVQVYDVSSQKPVTITVANLIETALDTLPVDDGDGVAVGDFYADSTTGVVTKKLS